MILLSYWDGLRNNEIAASLGVTQSCISHHQRTAMHRLRARLAEIAP
ncbi:MAG: sigma factor-like helix-turn-helix DNA-binding protein [Gammaproteobacteria bacterium]